MPLVLCHIFKLSISKSSTPRSVAAAAIAMNIHSAISPPSSGSGGYCDTGLPRAPWRAFPILHIRDTELSGCSPNPIFRAETWHTVAQVWHAYLMEGCPCWWDVGMTAAATRRIDNVPARRDPGADLSLISKVTRIGTALRGVLAPPNTKVGNFGKDEKLLAKYDAGKP